MSDSAGTAFTPASSAVEVVHEAYSFACMRCGHLWEQAYDIEHHIDADGRTVVMYLVDGERVPSPLTRPRCDYCDGHLVRIMRSGRVNNPDLRWPGRPAAPAEGRSAKRRSAKSEPEPAEPAGQPEPGGTGGRSAGTHHWHLPRLFHFHRKPGNVR